MRFFEENQINIMKKLILTITLSLFYFPLFSQTLDEAKELFKSELFDSVIVVAGSIPESDENYKKAKKLVSKAEKAKAAKIAEEKARNEALAVELVRQKMAYDKAAKAEFREEYDQFEDRYIYTERYNFFIKVYNCNSTLKFYKDSSTYLSMVIQIPSRETLQKKLLFKTQSGKKFELEVDDYSRKVNKDLTVSLYVYFHTDIKSDFFEEIIKEESKTPIRVQGRTSYYDVNINMGKSLRKVDKLAKVLGAK